ncbi:MAG: hypothetical protein AAFN10_25185 [Bacteroidota bacterium]
MGIKLKKDASDEAVIQSFQQYQPMLAREYQQWLASQEKPSVSESSEA